MQYSNIRRRVSGSTACVYPDPEDAVQRRAHAVPPADAARHAVDRPDQRPRLAPAALAHRGDRRPEVLTRFCWPWNNINTGRKQS